MTRFDTLRGVVMIAATNRPDHLHPACPPGPLRARSSCPCPTSRRGGSPILQVHCKGKRHCVRRSDLTGWPGHAGHARREDMATNAVNYAAAPTRGDGAGRRHRHGRPSRHAGTGVLLGQGGQSIGLSATRREQHIRVSRRAPTAVGWPTCFEEARHPVAPTVHHSCRTGMGARCDPPAPRTRRHHPTRGNYIEGT